MQPEFISPIDPLISVERFIRAVERQKASLGLGVKSSRGSVVSRPLRFHKHAYPEVCAILFGESVLCVENEQWHLRKGQVVYIPPGVRHFEIASLGTRRYVSLWIAVRPRTIRVCVRSHLQGDQGVEVRHEVQCPPNMALNLRALAGAGESIGSERLHCLVRKVLQYIRHNPAPAAPFGSTSYRIVERAQLLMQQHYASPITMDAIAQGVHVTPNYLAALFRSWVGCTPTQYLTHLRIHQAKKLLQDTRLTVAEIATEVGCESPFYLCRLFGKHVDMSPTEYRAKVVPDQETSSRPGVRIAAGEDKDS